MAQAARLASRLQRELKMLQSDPPPGVSAWPYDGHILTHLQAQIHGPEETVYANGIFKLDIQVPERYPFEPPNIKFITPVYHPNIDNGGRICLDILNLPPKGAWRPSLNLLTLLASIGLLLAEPNPDDGLMADITAEYKHARSTFDAKARNWTELYARQDQVTPEMVSETLANAEPNQKVGTVRVHGQEQMQASRSFGDYMNSHCASSSQPLRASLSLSKRLALDRGAACSQDTKAASSQGKTIQGKCIDSLRGPVAVSRNPSEEISFPTKGDAQSSNELAAQERGSKEGLALETSTSLSMNDKPSLHREGESVISSNHSRRGIFDGMVASVAIVDSLSHSASEERSSELGKGPQSESFCSPSVPRCVKVFDAEKSDGRNMSTSGQKRSDSVSVGKENQPPQHCPAAKPKDDSYKHLVGDKGLLAESRILEVSNSSSPTCVDLIYEHGGKDRETVCLPPRTKSLKLTRAKPSSNFLHATKGQQSILDEKQQAKKKWCSPIVVPDDVPTVVVSDSGSDGELSDEDIILSLTQRNLSNKRKANSKLR